MGLNKESIIATLASSVIITTPVSYYQHNGIHNYVQFIKCNRQSVNSENEVINSNNFDYAEIKRIITAYTDNDIDSKKIIVPYRSIPMQSTPETDIFRKNIEKLNEMALLDNNWDDNGAQAFDKTLLDNVKHLLVSLKDHQPDIFPTNNSTVQAEFYIQNNYLELILSKDKCEVYITDGENLDKDFFDDFEYDEEKIKHIVSSFYSKNKVR